MNLWAVNLKSTSVIKGEVFIVGTNGAQLKVASFIGFKLILECYFIELSLHFIFISVSDRF